MNYPKGIYKEIKYTYQFMQELPFSENKHGLAEEALSTDIIWRAYCSLVFIWWQMVYDEALATKNNTVHLPLPQNIDKTVKMLSL